jgi:hypothetical protein
MTTLYALVCDPLFVPIYVPPDSGSANPNTRDKKPWSGIKFRTFRKTRPLHRQRTLCQCCGGSPYTPIDAAGYRVCGYCRGDVIDMRAKMVYREHAEDAEAGAA